MKKRSKKYVEVAKLVENGRLYTPSEAVSLVKKTSISKFDGSVDVSIKLNIDTKKADQQIRSAIVLPHGTGKSLKVLVIAKGPKAQEAKDAGADYVGDLDMIEKIEKENWFDFDTIIATPDMMPQLGKIGKVLGPKGLMPNPKTGGVTMDVAGAVNDVKKGRLEFRADAQGNIHSIIGKVSFSENDLLDNLNAFVSNILKLRPSSVKGDYVLSIYLSSTMGPSIKVSNDFDK